MGISNWTYSIRRENDGSGADERSVLQAWKWGSLRLTGSNQSLENREGIQGKCSVGNEKAEGRMLGFIHS